MPGSRIGHDRESRGENPVQALRSGRRAADRVEVGHVYFRHLRPLAVCTGQRGGVASLFR